MLKIDLKVPDLNRTFQKMVGSIEDRLAENFSQAASDSLEYLHANTPKGLQPDGWRIQVNGVNVSAHNRCQIFNAVKECGIRTSFPVDFGYDIPITDEKMKKIVSDLLRQARDDFQANLRQMWRESTNAYVGGSLGQPR